MIENISSYHFFYKTVNSHRIYIIILLSLCFTFGLLPFIYIDITNQSRGIIRSSFENVQIQSLINGEIKSIYISENLSVKKGDTLLSLNTEHINFQLEILASNFSKNHEIINDLNQLISRNRPKLLTALYQSSYNQYLASLKEADTEILRLKQDLDIATQLFGNQVIPELDLFKANNNYNQAQNRREFIKLQYLNKWNTDLNNNLAKQYNLKTQLISLDDKKNRSYVIAPISGKIVKFSGQQTKSLLNTGQTIAFISPDTNLIIECFIDTKDIGYIYPNQEILYQFDAFNHHRWGLAKGNVIDISSELEILNQRPYFKVQCSLKELSLVNKSGQKAKLRKGMSLTARFYLDRRSLWQLLFNKLEQFTNPLIK